MVPHSWIMESVTLVEIADNTKKLLKNSMCNWKTEINANGTTLGGVNIWQGILQGDSFSLLLLVIVVIPLMRMQKQCDTGYTRWEMVTVQPIICCSWMTSNCLEGKTTKWNQWKRLCKNREETITHIINECSKKSLVLSIGDISHEVFWTVDPHMAEPVIDTECEDCLGHEYHMLLPSNL